MIGVPIFAGFVLLATLLCWLLVYARGHWAIKTAATIGVLFFSFAVWHALGSYRGWPTSVAPPAKSIFIAGVIHQPDPATGDAGTITLWLVPRHTGHSALAYNPAEDEPRAYRLPYSEELQKELMDAQHLQKGGGLVGFDKAHSGGTSNGGSQRNHGKFVPYVLPPPMPPRKGGS